MQATREDDGGVEEEVPRPKPNTAAERRLLKAKSGSHERMNPHPHARIARESLAPGYILPVLVVL